MPNFNNLDDPSISIPLHQYTLLRDHNLPPIQLILDDILRRQARQRHDYAEKTRHALNIIIANLIRAYSINPNVYVRISRNANNYGHNSPYCSLGYRSVERILTYLLGQDNYLDHYPGFIDRNRHYSAQTRIRASARFIEILTQEPTTGITNNAKLRYMVMVDRDHIDLIRLKIGNDLFEYEESESTNIMQSQLKEWNTFQQSHHIDLALPESEYNRLSITANDEHRSGVILDLSKRDLYRVFNENFDSGGRFYGGWWQDVPSALRNRIVIDGKLTHELDFKAMQPTMLYAMVGLPVAGDPYSIDGFDPAHRDAVKQAFLKLINAREGQRIRPIAVSELPVGWSWSNLKDALIEKHAPIERFFRSGIGIMLQRADSDIALQVMNTMKELNVLALPVHDSFIVAIEHAANVRRVMDQAFFDRYRQQCGITEDLSFVEEIGQTGSSPSEAYTEILQSVEYRHLKRRAELIEETGTGF